MDYEEILTPVALYRDRLKAEHAENSAAAFEELFKRSGVDAAANAELVKVIRKLEAEVAKLGSKLMWWKIFRGLMILVAIAGAVLGVMWLIPICGGDDLGVKTPVGASGFGGMVLALVLIFAWLNGKVKLFKELVAERQAELDRQIAEAWKMMEPLNKLFRWDTVAEIVMKTMPIMAIDRFVSVERVKQLEERFKWTDQTDETRSVLACQSGAVNGNPWVVADELQQTWGMKTYTGTLTITWTEQEYYTDSNGRRQSRRVTRSETLVATVDKPIPVYGSHKRLIYGNEAAPGLNFSRKPNSLSAETGGILKSRKLKNAVEALEKKSRDLSNTFTIMDNREFDACFDAVDRDNEQQFRLLFTPLAQQEMLTLLRERELGYGDDFTFIKRGMINTLLSASLDQLDVSSAPQIFKHYDLETARKNFNAYSNEFFRVFFFSFAPFFCIPLYQQHRNFGDIYQGIIDDGDAAFCEHESLANMIGDERFRPGKAATRCILKTAVESSSGHDAVLTVTAHAFRGEERVEYVSKYGGDGRYHKVPVHWIEYLPVSRQSHISVCNADTGDHLEFAEKLRTPEWKARLEAVHAGGATPLFRRGLAAFVR